ncbi:hypothetical protein JCM15519_10110 [Fundidesulfovibrio butyratiphilus]
MTNDAHHALHSRLVGFVYAFEGTTATILLVDSIRFNDTKGKSLSPPQVGIGTYLYAYKEPRIENASPAGEDLYLFRVTSYRSAGGDIAALKQVVCNEEKAHLLYETSYAEKDVKKNQHLTVRLGDMPVAAVAELVRGSSTFHPRGFLKVFLADEDILRKSLLMREPSDGGEAVIGSTVTGHAGTKGFPVALNDADLCGHAILFSSKPGLAVDLAERAARTAVPEKAFKILFTENPEAWERHLPCPERRWLDPGHLAAMIPRGFGVSTYRSNDLIAALGDQPPNVLKCVNFFLHEKGARDQTLAQMLAGQKDANPNAGEDSPPGLSSLFEQWSQEEKGSRISLRESDYICGLLRSIEENNLGAEAERRGNWLALDMTKIGRDTALSLCLDMTRAILNVARADPPPIQEGILWILDRAEECLPRQSDDTSGPLAMPVRKLLLDLLSTVSGTPVRILTTSRHPSQVDALAMKFFKHRIVGSISSEHDKKWLEDTLSVSRMELLHLTDEEKGNCMILDSPVLRSRCILRGE